MSARKLRLIHTPTPAWEAARAFYRDLLGLEERGGWELPGDRGAFLAAADGEIELMEQDAAALGILPPDSAGWTLALEVPDLPATEARLRAAGVPILRGIARRPWGSRDLLVRDPSGRALLLYDEPAQGDPPR